MRNRVRGEDSRQEQSSQDLGAGQDHGKVVAPVWSTDNSLTPSPAALSASHEHPGPREGAELGAWGPQALRYFHIPNPGRLRGSCWGDGKGFGGNQKSLGESKGFFEGVGGD